MGPAARCDCSPGATNRTPLDCGRPDCHASETEAAVASPMTHSLERFLDADPTAGGGCMLDCHVAGERGLRDGGFLDVARALPFRVSRASWDELPRGLRRVGGVTCTGCHGPAAIPEPSARRFVLSADVCATCHDAPPRYVHVEQWRASRMARSDESPTVRANPRCARCHSTAGFLAAIGVRKVEDATEGSAPFGIACAACHAPHGAHVGETLIRSVTVPEALGGQVVADRHPTSTVCIACHGPGQDEAVPSASAAALWLGRASPPGGEPLVGPAPHAALPGGCVACHGGPRPTEHSFHVERERCEACHESEPREAPDGKGRTLRERALALWRELSGPEPASSPPHAAPVTTPANPRARALYEVALVIEDPAAYAHNAAFARLLLDDAEAILRSRR